MRKTTAQVDPFTREIVKDSLIAIGEEMFYALARTSMSPIIYEVLDYASGLTDNKGQLLTQGNGVSSVYRDVEFHGKGNVEDSARENRGRETLLSSTIRMVGEVLTCPMWGW